MSEHNLYDSFDDDMTALQAARGLPFVKAVAFAAMSMSIAHAHPVIEDEMVMMASMYFSELYDEEDFPMDDIRTQAIALLVKHGKNRVN